MSWGAVDAVRLLQKNTFLISMPCISIKQPKTRYIYLRNIIMWDKTFKLSKFIWETTKKFTTKKSENFILTPFEFSSFKHKPHKILTDLCFIFLLATT